MALEGFTPVPFAATLGGAPIDAFQLDAFRRNDLLFEQLLRGLMCSPFFPSGFERIKRTNPEAHEFVNAREIEVTNEVSLTKSVPLIWFASEKITLGANINGHGAGAQPEGSAPGETGTGDFGGSGGGSIAGAGHGGRIPVTGAPMPGLEGGLAASPGIALPVSWAKRGLGYMAIAKGGSAGANQGAALLGGAGGGIVILCAPTIEFTGTARIIATGQQGAAGAGGGGGGLVALICRQLIPNLPPVDIDGGTAAGGGGDGGRGCLLTRNLI